MGHTHSPMKHVYTAKPALTGHYLVHRGMDHAHVVTFDTAPDDAWVVVKSWNAPDSHKAKPWVLLLEQTLKKVAARKLWKELRDRGYRRGGAQVNAC